MSKIQTAHEYKCDLDVGPLEVKLRKPLMHQDALADVFRVRVFRNGKDLSITGMVARGFMYSEVTRETIPLLGVVEGSFASVTLIDKCYAVPGEANLSIQLQEGDVCHTLASIHFDLRRTGTNVVTDPAGVLPTLPNLLSKITVLEQTTAAAKTETENAVKATADTLSAVQKFSATAAPAIIPTAVGAGVVAINDSAERPLAGLRLYGSTTQAKTTGKNLLNYDAWKTVGLQRGTAVWENGGVTITATGDDCYTNDGLFIDDYPAKISVTPGESITLSWDADRSYSARIFIFPNGTTDGAVACDNNENRPLVYTATEGVSYVTLRFSAATAGDVISYRNIMVERGSQRTAYEPYTGGIPAPSPLYSQPLVNVGAGGSIKIKAQGKNLLNVPEQVNISGNEYVALYAQLSLPEGYYTLSFVSSAAVGCQATYKENLPVINTRPNERMVQVFYATGGIDTFSLFVGGTATISQCMLEAGNTASGYEPYKDGGSLTASTPGGMAGIPTADGGMLCDYIEYGHGVYVQNVQRIVLDGDENITYDQDAFNVAGVINSGGQAYMAGLCNAYPVATTYGEFISGDFAVCNWSNDALRIRHGGSTDVASFREWLSSYPVTLYFPMPAPAYRSISAEEMVEYRAMTTHWPTTIVTNDTGAAMHVDYIADTKTYIDQRLAAIAAALIAQN